MSSRSFGVGGCPAERGKKRRAQGRVGEKKEGAWWQKPQPQKSWTRQRFRMSSALISAVKQARVTVLTAQKQVVLKPIEMANAAAGFAQLQERIERLGVAPQQVVVGLEATSRDAGESLALSPAARVSPVFVASSTNP